MNCRHIVMAGALGALMLPGPSIGTPSSPTLAGTLADAYRARTAPAELEISVRLQLAAGRYEEAEATAQRLDATYREREPARAGALLPFRIYARAMRYQADGLAAREAVARAFSELFAPLSDADMADALRWLSANPQRLREAVERAEQACATMPLDGCAGAADVIAARETVAVWSMLMPISEALIRSDAERRFSVADDLLIPMPDGTRIAAMVVRPRGDQTRVTALLNFTIYARDDWSLADAVKMAAHGYAGVVAYSRGKGRGTGTAIPYEHDGADAAATVEWLARQPWSDGRVGMFSGSYNAFTQWAALKHRPRALRAIATNASNAPGIDTPMRGNVFQNFIYPWPLYTSDGNGLDDASYDDRARWAALDRNWYRSGRPYRDLERIDGQPNPVFDAWLDHPSYDSYWQALIPQGREFARIQIPVFVQTGYFDGGMVGALYYLQEHVRRRPDADHRLLVGPYHHTAMQTGVLSRVAGYDVDPAAMIDLQAVRLQWFDHVFRGAPLPPLLSDRVNFEVMGADRWRHVPSLEAMAGERLRLYLTGRQAGQIYAFGGTRPQAGDGAPTLTVNFADRSDADAPPPDGIDTSNALVFMTAPLPRPMEIDGLFRGRFDTIANKRDFDLRVQFFEQRPDGSFFPLGSFLGRASFIGDRSRRRLLEPGRMRRLDFESQTLTARRTSAGSRIVAVVGVPKEPHLQINYGTGRDVSDESVADAREPLTVRWLPGSYLELGVRN